MASASSASNRATAADTDTGAKPGHGGILPRSKVTEAIAEARGMELSKIKGDIVSPPRHSAFQTAKETLEFIRTLREASGGKPVGFKLCVGRPDEFACLVHAMLDTGILPDFITGTAGHHTNALFSLLRRLGSDHIFVSVSLLILV